MKISMNGKMRLWIVVTAIISFFIFIGAMFHRVIADFLYSVTTLNNLARHLNLKVWSKGTLNLVRFQALIQNNYQERLDRHKARIEVLQTQVGSIERRLNEHEHTNGWPTE